jgi:uncharacterized membrane protein
MRGRDNPSTKTTSNIPSLSSGLKYNVSVNVTVPLDYPAGSYNGTVNVSAQNDHFDTFTLEARVPSKRGFLAVIFLAKFA